MLNEIKILEILNRIVDDIFAKGKTFYGKPLTLRKLVDVEETKIGGRILVPAWFPTLQKGRGRRKSETYQGFDIAIYNWMEKRNMFVSKTNKGKMNEARSLAWYINKHGNKHYRSGRYIDIYDTIIKEASDSILNEYGEYAVKRISEIVKI